MQKLYETYKDIVEFRLVYIHEAHAADSSWSVPYAKDLGINDHKTYGERCDVAEKLLNDKNLTIPTIIDGIDNEVSEAYGAHPDRIFLVHSDGTLGISAARGPWGYAPALGQVRDWLSEFKKSGRQVALARKQSDRSGFGGRRPRAKRSGNPSEGIIGTWDMSTAYHGEKIEATMIISRKDGRLVGLWKSMGRDMPLQDVKLDGNKLSFTRMVLDAELVFSGELDGLRIIGKYAGDYGELECTGEKIE